MKKYVLLSLVFIAALLSSCQKSYSDNEIPTNDNNPSGDYLYSSNSKYYSGEDQIEYEGLSKGNMHVNWTSGNTTMSIQITPNIGYSYSILASNLENHGDTTTFRISAQTVTIQNETFNLRGTNAIDVPNIGKYDGYFIQNKQIVYAYKSSNIENYEFTETTTEGNKRN